MSFDNLVKNYYQVDKTTYIGADELCEDVLLGRDREEKDNMDELFDHAVDRAVAAGYLTSGDLVVITAGAPLGISGTTNLLKVHLVGNILVQGKGATGYSACGNLCVARDEEEAFATFRPGDILVIPQTSNHLLPLLKEAAGIVTEIPGLNSHAAIVGMALEKPVIVGAAAATKILKSGTTVTLDAERGIVMFGTIKDA